MSQFVDEYLNQLVSQALDGAKGLVSEAQPPVTDLGIDGPGPDRFDRQAVTQYFSGEKSDIEYVEAMDSASGSSKDRLGLLAASKLRSDIMGQLERDEKLRRVSFIRSKTLQASRLYRHGNPGGPIQNNILHMINKLASTETP